ncbi:MAG TPA: FkbM family methyltransferase [Rhizomicrobium sp.]
MNRFKLEELCRTQVQPVYLGARTALCRILGRYKFYVDTADSGFGSNVLLDGFWEMWLTQFMARVVKPGMVVADIGANFGYYTLLLADLVGPDGRVFAVEPNPAAAALLTRAVALNGFAGRTTIAVAGLGARDGEELLLYVPHDEPKNATVVPSEAHGDPARGAIRRVPSRSLDALLDGQARLDFIKIDAEGAEEAIVAGMMRTIETQRPSIVLEFNAARYADPAAYLARLTACYDGLRHIDYSGHPVAVAPHTVLTERYAEDWLLFFGRPG